ncbi:MAG: DUF4430 domain-containing protein [Lachnospiraceae bacterium]|jgi:hypothetical protein|nr:DUF4430 domain-containing protein [Lachnospiraceae bacterium]
MKTNQRLMKLVSLFSLVIMLMFAVSTLTACGNKDNTKKETKTETVSKDGSKSDNSSTDIGEGKTKFTFSTTDKDGNVKTWNVSTDEKTVGDALLKVKLVSGDKSSTGLMITTVNGTKLDYNKDKAFWGFYIDGKMASDGADSTDIENGKTYSFNYTKAN